MLTIFILSLLTLALSLSFTLTLVNDYYWNNPNKQEHYTFLVWLTYFTHLSVVLVVFWSFLELCSNVFKLEWKLNFIRIYTIACISLTGIGYFIPWIFLVVRDISVLVGNANLPDWNQLNRGSQKLYAFIDISQTTLMHVIIPIFSFYIFRKNSIHNEQIEKKYLKKIIALSSLFIFIYFCYINILVLVWGIPAPYPFFNWNEFNELWMILVMLLSALIVGIVFILINYYLIRIQNKHENIDILEQVYVDD